MHFVCFQIGDARVVLDTACIREIVPLVDITPLPHAPAGIAGICDFRGAPTPVIDLTAVVLGRRSARRLSTRLIVLNDPERLGEHQTFALLAERVTDTVQRDPAAFTELDDADVGMPCLGPVAVDAGGLVQRLDPRRLRSLVAAPTGDRR